MDDNNSLDVVLSRSDLCLNGDATLLVLPLIVLILKLGLLLVLDTASDIRRSFVTEAERLLDVADNEALRLERLANAFGLELGGTGDALLEVGEASEGLSTSTSGSVKDTFCCGSSSGSGVSFCSNSWNVVCISVVKGDFGMGIGIGFLWSNGDGESWTFGVDGVKLRRGSGVISRYGSRGSSCTAGVGGSDIAVFSIVKFTSMAYGYGVILTGLLSSPSLTMFLCSS